MTDDTTLIPLAATPETGDDRSAERRRFLKLAGASTAIVGGLGLLAACGKNDNDETPSPTPSPTPTPTSTNSVTDADLLNFMLNLLYVQAQFYSIAALGRAVPEASLTGTIGTRGNVTGGRKVTFVDRATGDYAREIANEKIAQVNVLRTILTTSTTAAIAQPAINIDGGASGTFTALMRQAGVIGANDTFDPYASEGNFLLSAFVFEDLGATAYKGLSPLIVTLNNLESLSGLLGAQAYHAGLIRTAIYVRGDAALRTNTTKISDLRDSLDGAPATATDTSKDLDQGVVNADGTANIVPADANGITFSRTPGQVLNVLYLRKDAGTSGGFFPAGINNRLDTLKSSAASG